MGLALDMETLRAPLVRQQLPTRMVSECGAAGFMVETTAAVKHLYRSLRVPRV